MVTCEQLILPSDADVTAINQLLHTLKQDGSVIEKIDIEDMLGHDTVELWVARIEGVVVGMATLIEVPMLLKTKAVVEDVVVSSEHQGKGIGRTIMQCVIDRAKEKGVSYVDLTSRPTRAAANALYLKVGFVVRDTNCYRYNF